MTLPLEGLLVLEFSQYLAGPYAGLRLADLGARVIKIERPGSGEAGRQLAIKELFLDGDSLTFHAINRRKESYTANLKSPDDLERVKQLIARADILTHNFRPGVMENIGLGFERVSALNPRLIYGAVTGYTNEGPWRNKPGQDLLVQAMSGLTWLTGDSNDPPVPFGLAVADLLCGDHLAQGLLAALLRRGRTGQGALVEVSLMESLIHLQFEVLTTYFNGGQPPKRARHRNAHAYLGAPYGIYETEDGWLAVAMGSLAKLGELIGCHALIAFAEDTTSAFECRDQIKAILQQHLKTGSTAHWLNMLEPADYWCSDVLSYDRLFAHAGYKVLGMDQKVHRPNGLELSTLRCPIRIDGERLYSTIAAPKLGNANDALNRTL